MKMRRRKRTETRENVRMVRTKPREKRKTWRKERVNNVTGNGIN